MRIKTAPITIAHLKEHETKKGLLWKFLILVFIILTYAGFMSWHYGLANGFMIALLTWSFFTLCTPMADAGFILDFPIRILFRVKMLFSEMFVWVFSIAVNIYALHYLPSVYDKVMITSLFKKILLTPYPYWSIILLSMAGTFLSIRLGDELLDVIHHKDCVIHHKHGWKLDIIITLFFFLFVFLAYGFLLRNLGIDAQVFA